MKGKGIFLLYRISGWVYIILSSLGLGGIYIGSKFLVHARALRPTQIRLWQIGPKMLKSNDNIGMEVAGSVS